LQEIEKEQQKYKILKILIIYGCLLPTINITLTIKLLKIININDIGNNVTFEQQF